jgi:hypothetical protein
VDLVDLMDRMDPVDETGVDGGYFRPRHGLHSVHSAYFAQSVRSPTLAQHQLGDLQSVKGGPFKELVTTAPER